MKLFYITRTLYPYQKGGGAQVRAKTINKLRELGWDVVVVMPGYRQIRLRRSDNLITIPILPILKITKIFQRFGLFEDYLDLWVSKSLRHLKGVVKKNDLVFVTSGGELGTLKLGALLKSETNCKLVLNFRDPLEYALCNNSLIDNSFHVSREKVEKKYLSAADLLVTSSKSYQKNLVEKYPEFSQKLLNNYFGFLDAPSKIKPKDIQDDSVIRICFMGSMTEAQKPEILIKAFKGLNNCIKNKIELVFIGNHSLYKGFSSYRNLDKVSFINYMPKEQLRNYLQNNIHIGFVSLFEDYYGSCIPSKIYEYIGLELPILAALPSGDAMDIINQNNFGLACLYNDIQGLQLNIEKMTDHILLNSIRTKLNANKSFWSMDSQLNKLSPHLKALTKIKHS